MKSIIASLLGLGALSLCCSCTTVQQREPATVTTSTTTEQSTVSSPAYNTIETKTTRSY